MNIIHKENLNISTSNNNKESSFIGRSNEDLAFKFTIILLGAGIPIFMLFLYLNTLIRNSLPAIITLGFDVFINKTWDPNHDIYSFRSFIFGTVATSVVAILIALPLSLLASVFVYEYVPERLAAPIRGVIDLLAGIPSVIFGLWGLFVLIPTLGKTIFPFIEKRIVNENLVNLQTIFTAGIVLAVMITPILVNIIMDGFDSVPDSLREAMIGLGATRWEVSRNITIGTTKPTIFVAVMLGLGRAFGETMAVIMVVGNASNPEGGIFAIFKPGATISSILANQFGDATGALFISSLFEIALLLFVVTAIFNLVGLLILKRLKER